MLKVHGRPPDVDGILGKAGDVVGEDVFGPGREDDRQPRAVGDAVVGAGQFVLELMAAHHVLLAAAGQPVVGKAARPHQGGAGLVILRVFNRAPARLDNGADKPLGEGVGEGVVLI